MEGCIGMGIGLLGCLRGTGDGEYIRLAADTAREAERVASFAAFSILLFCAAGHLVL
jgi:hypothetical protein